MNTRDLLSLPPAEALAEGFARTLVDLAESAGVRDEEALTVLRAGARAASLATASGHTCVHLAELARDVLPGSWRYALLATGLVARAGDGRWLPLVLDEHNRLYLYRYFEVERRLAGRLRAFGALPLDAAAEALVGERLAERFGADDESTPDQQRRAVAHALGHRLTIVSGGPGTGKTTTVVQILALLLELDPDCRILLAAPTGKAAARLRDAVQAGGRTLPEALRRLLPNESFTVHRLLARAGEDGGQIACDALVVDEASMLDLMLTERLLAALGPRTRLIMLGDRHQLAAVEAGAVFSELSAQDSALQSQVVELRRSYRFGSDTALGRLAAAAREGRREAVLQALSAGDPDVRFDAGSGAELSADALAALLAGYGDYLHALRQPDADPLALFAALGRFRVLCAVRDGARGVAGLNDALARRLRAALAHPADPGALSPWYPGRPVLILRNEPLLRLFNGDIGIALPTGDGIKVFFEDTAAPGGWRSIAPARLPPHETAFVMTVHKSQGSEFERVAIVLPAKPAPVCTRELVYTGITRARRGVLIAAPPEVLNAALATPTLRHSGLHERLREEA